MHEVLDFREQTVAEVVTRWPGTAGVLLEWGMACPGCVMGPFETLPEVAVAYRKAPASLLKAIRIAIEREESLRRRDAPLEAS